MSSGSISRPCVVNSVIGTSPGPASQIKYKFDIGFDNDIITTPTAITPDNPNRLPDVIKTIAQPVGTDAICIEIGGVLKFFVWETFDFDMSCE